MSPIEFFALFCKSRRHLASHVCASFSFRAQNKVNLGAENEAQNGFPLRAAYQAGAVLGLFLEPHLGLRFGANLDLFRSKLVYARFTQFFPEVQHSMDTTFTRLKGYYKVVGLCSASFAGSNCNCTAEAL